MSSKGTDKTDAVTSNNDSGVIASMTSKNTDQNSVLSIRPFVSICKKKIHILTKYLLNHLCQYVKKIHINKISLE